MSTYVEILNSDGAMKIGDTYECQRLVSSGTIVANITLGEVYGIALDAGNGCMLSFRGSVGSTVYISPTVVWNGKLIKYITSDSSDPITWYKWGKANYNFAESKSNVGVEFFNANSTLVYSSNQNTGSFSEMHIINPNEAYEIVYAPPHTYTNNTYLTATGSVAALCSPWYTTMTLYADYHTDNCDIFFAGYKFTSTSIEVGGTTVTHKITTLLGDGDLSQIRQKVYMDSGRTHSKAQMNFAGISCFNYMFFIIDTSIN